MDGNIASDHVKLYTDNWTQSKNTASTYGLTSASATYLKHTKIKKLEKNKISVYMTDKNRYIL